MEQKTYPKRLPYGKQTIEQDDIEIVMDALQSDFLTTGPYVQNFEKKLAAYTSTKDCCAVNSGTAALQATYEAISIGTDDEIITTPITFLATASAALMQGAKVKFADIDPTTGNIDPKSAESLISDKTKAIVSVDYSGLPVEYDELRNICHKKGIYFISDCCHSIGADYKGKKTGALADASCFSFHPVKTITTAEGGAIVSNKESIIEKAKAFRSHGINHDPKLKVEMGPWFHSMDSLGYNYRLSDLQCALGISQLKKLDRFIQKRREIADIYNKAFSTQKYFDTPARFEHKESAWHLYVIQLKDPTRRRVFFEKLQSEGILCQIHYIPVYWHKHFQNLGYKKGLCPRAENFYESIISLPIYPLMTMQDIEFCIDKVLGSARSVL